MTKSREEYSENLESQYRRMERAYEKVLGDFESTSFSKSSEEKLDAVYDFFLICYHLREWINRDEKVSNEIKKYLPTFEKKDSPVQFQMCRDLCNKSKHVMLEKAKRPNDAITKIISSGGAVFRVSKKELAEAHSKKETIHLKSEDAIFMGRFVVSFKGAFYELKGVVQGCMYVWKDFFKKNDLLLPRNTPFQKERVL